MKPEAKGVRIRKLTVMANFQDKKKKQSRSNFASSI